jgi:pSer/pThr/pTyr-binding forkhead associated (FHA) protein
MEVQIKVLVGGNKGQMVKVPGPKFFVGRAEDCHLRPGSDLVSRHHCVLMIEENLVIVRDFGSKNGTYVNGERLSGETELKHGDRLKIGPLEFEMCIQHSLAGAMRPAVHSIKEAAVRTAESGIHEDVDVNEWLKPAPGKDVGDTREFNRNDTAELEMMQNTVVNEPAPAPAETAPAAEEAEEETQPRKAKVLGKQTAKPSVGDSHSAAADALKKLRRRT